MSETCFQTCLFCCEKIFRFLRESLETKERAKDIFRICLEFHVGIL